MQLSPVPKWLQRLGLIHGAVGALTVGIILITLIFYMGFVLECLPLLVLMALDELLKVSFQEKSVRNKS